MAGELVLALAHPEDVAATLVKEALGYEVVDPATGLESRVEADTRLGPEAAVVEVALDVVLDPLVPQREEAGDVAAVVVDEVLAELEDVHGSVDRVGQRLACRWGHSHLTDEP